MIIQITNDFHNTTVNLRVAKLPATLTTNQVYRARRTLCGLSDCTCGGGLSDRGNQSVHIGYDRDYQIVILETDYDGQN